LRSLARHAGLTAFDVRLLVTALLPDLDSRFEKLYGYLNDDVTRRRASIGLALELAGAVATSATARRALSPSGPLVDLGLVLVEDPERPYLTRSLRVPDRVVSYLLGDSSPDAAIRHVLLDVEGYRTPLADRIGRALDAGAAVVHVRERETGTATATAVAALETSGRTAVVADLALVARAPDPDVLVRTCAREALIRGAGLVAGPVEALAESHVESVQELSGWPCPVIFVGAATWDPLWSADPPLSVEAPILGAVERITLLRTHLERRGADVAPDSLAAHLSLGPAQVQRAVHAAGTAAMLGTGRITAADLRSGIRAQNAAGLERLSRRIEPEVSWDDLVLAPAVRQALEELTARARHRDQVLVDWRMRRGGGRGRGVSALFAGDSGTGKTMSAEVIAADLGLDLYTVNLATVVDKYVGETEKNLERIFTEAGGVNAVLFFDEADAIFGKRSEVRDAHDRYANIESAYLLQRLETFDGLAVLATNLRANIDEAFTRRLDAIVDFPSPTPDLREALWRQCLGPPLPLADDVDIPFCADSFEFAGGNIRSAATTAAYLAAEARGPVTMSHVIAAVAQEYRKLGRLVLEKEFGHFLALLPG
jgi:Winged helix domain, variant/ATPase family associated with various cellular activities (AAA)